MSGVAPAIRRDRGSSRVSCACRSQNVPRPDTAASTGRVLLHMECLGCGSNCRLRRGCTPAPAAPAGATRCAVQRVSGRHAMCTSQITSPPTREMPHESSLRAILSHLSAAQTCRWCCLLCTSSPPPPPASLRASPSSPAGCCASSRLKIRHPEGRTLSRARA